MDDAAGGVQYLRQSILFYDNGLTESLLNGLVLQINHPYIKIDHVETLISFIETLFFHRAFVYIKDVNALHYTAFLTLCGQYKIQAGYWKITSEQLTNHTRPFCQR